MEVLIDDRPYTGPQPQTLRELAQEACSTASSPRLVVSVRCDGRPLVDSELSAVLDEPPGRFGKIELHTQPLLPLVRSTLEQAIRSFEEASSLREEIADHLTQGRQTQAMEKLQTLFGTWRQVQECLTVGAEAIGLDLNALPDQGIDLPALLEVIRNQLGELKQAVQAGDFVVVGDILRYELEEPFTQWQALLEYVHEQTLGPEH